MKALHRHFPRMTPGVIIYSELSAFDSFGFELPSGQASSSPAETDHGRFTSVMSGTLMSANTKVAWIHTCHLTTDLARKLLASIAVTPPCSFVRSPERVTVRDPCCACVNKRPIWNVPAHIDTSHRVRRRLRRRFMPLTWKAFKTIGTTCSITMNNLAGVSVCSPSLCALMGK